MSSLIGSGSGSEFTFSILQQIISDYLYHNLDTKNCDELSAEMMELLCSLIKFGFYHTMEHLQDITFPLIQVSVAQFLFHL